MMSGQLKPICVNCQRFLRPEKNGQSVLEQMPRDRAPPGRTHWYLWEPYKLWRADLWKCSGCGFELVIGAGEREREFAEHFQPGFELELARCRKERLVVVNDC